MKGRSEERGNSLRDFYFVLFRQKRKVVLFFFVVMIMVIIGNMTAQEIFLSRAKLMIRIGRESVTLDPTATTGQVVSIGQNRENEINSEIEILKNRELLEKVVDTLGIRRFTGETGQKTGIKAWLEWPKAAIKSVVKPLLVSIKAALGSKPTDPEEAAFKEKIEVVKEIEKHLDVNAVKKSNIIEIAYQAPSSLLAHDVLQTLVDLYLDKHISVYRTAGSYRFFKEQTAQLRSAIEKTEQQIKELKDRYGMASLSDQKRVLVDRIGTLQQELERTRFAKAASQARVQELKRSLATLPRTLVVQKVTGSPRSVNADLRKRIYELRMKEQELLSTFTENSIQVQEIRRQIKEAEAMLRSSGERPQVTEGANPAYQRVQINLLDEETKLAALRAKSKALAEQLEETTREVKKLNEVEIRLKELLRELETQKNNYRKYSESLEQTRIDQALEMEKISNISVVQPATFPVRPIRPNKRMNLLIGLMLGILGGVALAFLAEHQDHTIKRPEDVDQYLQVPVVGSVPDWGGPLPEAIPTGAARQRSPEYREPLRDLRRALGIPEKFGNYWDPLWDNITLLDEELLHRSGVCVVTSCKLGEGVTTVAAQLAADVASREDGRVLLVDTNPSQARLHRLFGKQPQPGFADLAASEKAEAEMFQPSGINGLDVVCCGSRETDPTVVSRYLEAEAFTRLLDLWRMEYRLVIFDAPALSEDLYTSRLSAVADFVLWVIEAEEVRTEALESARDRLLQAKVKQLGVVLNKRRYYIPDWLYRSL